MGVQEPRDLVSLHPFPSSGRELCRGTEKPEPAWPPCWSSWWTRNVQTGPRAACLVSRCTVAGSSCLSSFLVHRTKPTHTTVNCWFCSQDTVVPYGNRNCWDCPHCEQYNGFQEVRPPPAWSPPGPPRTTLCPSSEDEEAGPGGQGALSDGPYPELSGSPALLCSRWRVGRLSRPCGLGPRRSAC